MPPPNNAAELLDQALKLHQQGRIAPAKEIYAQLLPHFPKNPDILRLYGTAEFQLGNAEAAAKLLQKSLKVDPEQADALNNLGNALNALDRHMEALQCFEKAIKLAPEYVEAYSNRGSTLRALRKFEEALKNFDAAIAVNPAVPEFHNNRGNCLRDLGRMEEALQSFDAALLLAPDYAEAISNRANVLRDLGRADEADAQYQQAIERKHGTKIPDHLPGAVAGVTAAGPEAEFADAYWNKAVVKLLKGEFEEGWRLYEWRWRTKSFLAKNTPRPGDLWRGDAPLKSKKIRIYPEQGLGDFIQFVRYVPLLEAMGAQVILETPPSLMSVIGSMKGEAMLVPVGGDMPAYDYQCPIMSLPFALGTTLDSVPAAIPYLFADEAKQATWGELLGPKTRPRVGLIWSGAAQHINDHHRSIALATLHDLLGAEVEFHALQKELREADHVALGSLPQLQWHADALNDFSDTAALIAQLDLVISVDTSVAHLAGAMGKNVWLLLPFAPDYRWMLQREDSPWYPSMRLFRQEKQGDWGPVLQKIEETLRDRATFA